MSKDGIPPVSRPKDVVEACEVSCRATRMQGMKAAFLRHLSKSGNVSESSRIAGVERSTLYSWRDADVVFAKEWECALEDAVDILESEARRRAVEGYDELVLSGGRMICDSNGSPVTRRKYSDGLLSFLLRAHRPSRFGDTDRDEKSGMITITITPDDSVL